MKEEFDELAACMESQLAEFSKAVEHGEKILLPQNSIEHHSVDFSQGLLLLNQYASLKNSSNNDNKYY